MKPRRACRPQARCDFRHRTRQGIIRLQNRAGDARQRAFPPDVISSDVHQLCIDGPAFDQVTTMSKFLCLGMDLADVIKCSTLNAAIALKRMEYGSLKVGSLGYATILTVKEGAFRLCRRHRRASDRGPQNRQRRRGAEGAMVAPEAQQKIPENNRLSPFSLFPSDGRR